MIYPRPRIPVVLIVVALSLAALMVTAFNRESPVRRVSTRVTANGTTLSKALAPALTRLGTTPVRGIAVTESLDVLSQRLTLSLDAFYAGVVRGEQERAEAQRVAEEAAVMASRSVGRFVTVASSARDWESFAACVIAHESGGVADAQNRSSSASGLFQDLDSTWGGYGGYAHAKDAPESVQYAMNYELWQRAGSSPWAGSGC